MKIVSIDIGIKNLAICIIEAIDNKIEIIYWNIINLCNDTPKNCIYIDKNKPCTNNAKFYNNDNCYCKKHTSKTDFIIPCVNLKNYKKLNLKELTDIIEKYNIICPEKSNKSNYIEAIHDYILLKQLLPILSVNANNVDLIDLGINIKKLLNDINFDNIDYVLIENQISPIANRMKTLQGMIAQYFIMNDKSQIVFVSAANKLKGHQDIETDTTTYAARKKEGIKCTLKLIGERYPDWLPHFTQHKKKDDLADAFLQGNWYLNKN